MIYILIIDKKSFCTNIRYIDIAKNIVHLSITLFYSMVYPHFTTDLNNFCIYKYIALVNKFIQDFYRIII